MDPKVESAIDYVLHWEDSTLSGKVTEDAGGKTRFGIAQRFHPNLTDENFYAIPVDEALAKAKDVYEKEYAAAVQASSITDDCVRNKVLDMVVNPGHMGKIIAQRAVGAVEDGAFGPNTLMLINSASPDSFLTRVSRMCLTYYDSLQATENEHKSWASRAKCLGKIGTNLVL